MQSYSYLVSFTCHKSSSLLQDLGTTSSVDEDLVAVKESKHTVLQFYVFGLKCSTKMDKDNTHILCFYLRVHSLGEWIQKNCDGSLDSKKAGNGRRKVRACGTLFKDDPQKVKEGLAIIRRERGPAVLIDVTKTGAYQYNL